jgi:type II secretory pathway pseudopilin PulG
MHRKPGFGILEALIVLMIAGFILGVIVTSLTRDRTAQDLSNVEHAFTSMMLTARQETLTHHCALRIHMLTKQRPHKIVLEQETISPQGHKFIPATTVGGTTSYTLPSTWIIKAVYQGHEEQLSKNKGSAFCTLPTDGLLPQMLIHLQGTQKKQVATLKTEPFQKIFTRHNSLIAPPKKPLGAQ